MIAFFPSYITLRRRVTGSRSPSPFLLFLHFILEKKWLILFNILKVCILTGILFYHDQYMVYNVVLWAANRYSNCSLYHTDRRHGSAGLDTMIDHLWILWQQIRIDTYIPLQLQILDQWFFIKCNMRQYWSKCLDGCRDEEPRYVAWQGVVGWPSVGSTLV